MALVQETYSLQDKRKKVNDMLYTLEEDDLNMAISYIRFLESSRKQQKKDASRQKLRQLQQMFEDDKGGYSSEEDMIRDLAAFRRERIGP